MFINNNNSNKDFNIQSTYLKIQLNSLAFRFFNYHKHFNSFRYSLLIRQDYYFENYQIVKLTKYNENHTNYNRDEPI